ncbi:MAG: hypothetical protein KJ625_08035 [Actinobacteria bacterium]|nr:hypothetical protein [Actinomycetota bacterium]MCG2701634.1 hypothetical protein [Candidatus Parcubacteria bacterium]
MNTCVLIGPLNSREEALLFLLAVLFVLALSFKSTRSSIFDFVIFLFNKKNRKILAVLLAVILYVELVVLLLCEIQFWDVFLVKDTIFWFVGVALILLFNIIKATENEEHYFKNILLETLAFVGVLEFVVSIYTFNFWIEIFLILVVSILVLTYAVAKTKEEYAPVGKVIEFLLAAFILFFIGYALFKTFADYQKLLTLDNLRAFFLPIILTFAYLPFLYFFALYMVYDTLFTRLNLFSNKDKGLVRLARRKILILCHINLKKLNRFAKENTQELIRLDNRNDVLRMVDEFKKKGS